VGAISHTAAIGAALVAHEQAYWGAGVDVELADRPLRLALAERVARPTERRWIECTADPEDQRQRLLRLVMAKEATFKAFYPQARVFLGFADAELDWDGAGFSGRLCREASPHHPAGTCYRVACTAQGSLWIAWTLIPR
jgi:4'-phosphopantetheinyl transferase EntD